MLLVKQRRGPGFVYLQVWNKKKKEEEERKIKKITRDENTPPVAHH